ncbi:MAG: class I SAM-dependent methyltransferase [Candidatus Omnitrophica bacterium]|nr:class I SAM-dependent methyltransferase [Candidatus Omnitrophota bacterium]
MNKDVYLVELNKLKNLMIQVADTPFVMYAKVLALVTMNMRYEKVAFNMDLKDHPYSLTREIIKDAINQFKALIDISFIESDDKNIKSFKSQIKEEKHRKLFDEIWNRYDEKNFEQYIDRYVHRIKINSLGGLIENKSCVDLGCGNGVFCFALLNYGAGFVAGVDFGEKSITYARNVARKKRLGAEVMFKQTTLYETGFEDNAFDFAIQNGVFHHLEDEQKAIRETKRILKKGGWFWYYTDGEGGISYDLWDASVEMLKDVPVLFLEGILESMNVNRNKIVHLSDGLSATYAHTSWDKITKKLSDKGFGNFRRLKGGFETDFDLDKIEPDPYGKEKFGEGDLRILCQLLEK